MSLYLKSGAFNEPGHITNVSRWYTHISWDFETSSIRMLL